MPVEPHLPLASSSVMRQVLRHAMHHAMQAHLLLELFCPSDPLEQLRFGDEDGVELLARVLLLAPTALPLRRAFAQKLEHEELAVLRGREEVGLIVRDAQPRYRPTMDLRRCGEPNWSEVGTGGPWLRVSRLRGCRLVEPAPSRAPGIRRLPTATSRPGVLPTTCRRTATGPTATAAAARPVRYLRARREGGRFWGSAREDALEVRQCH